MVYAFFLNCITNNTRGSTINTARQLLILAEERYPAGANRRHGLLIIEPRTIALCLWLNERHNPENLVRPFTIGEKGLSTPSVAVYEVNSRTMDKTQIMRAYSHYAPLREPTVR